MNKFIAKISVINYEFTDSFLVPNGVAEIDDVLAFTNQLGIRITGTVVGLHDEPGCVYMPLWMLYTLKITHGLSMETVETVGCTKIIIKPYNKDFIKNTNWSKELECSLNKFKCVSSKTTIPVNIDGSQQIFIDRMFPETHKTFSFHKNTGNVEISILQSFEEDEIIKRNNKKSDFSNIPYLVMVPQRLRMHPLYETLSPFSGIGNTLIGDTDTTKTPAQNAYAAVMKRMNALRK